MLPAGTSFRGLSAYQFLLAATEHTVLGRGSILEKCAARFGESARCFQISLVVYWPGIRSAGYRSASGMLLFLQGKDFELRGLARPLSSRKHNEQLILHANARAGDHRLP